MAKSRFEIGDPIETLDLEKCEKMIVCSEDVYWDKSTIDEKPIKKLSNITFAKGEKLYLKINFKNGRIENIQNNKKISIHYNGLKEGLLIMIDKKGVPFAMKSEYPINMIAYNEEMYVTNHKEYVILDLFQEKTGHAKIKFTSFDIEKEKDKIN